MFHMNPGTPLRNLNPLLCVQYSLDTVRSRWNSAVKRTGERHVRELDTFHTVPW